MVKHSNKLVVLTGFSGAGKDTIAAELKKRGYSSAIPHTTREMRVNEVEGDPYYFITMDQFDKMIEENKFAEHNGYKTMFNGVESIAKYGTSIDSIDPEKKQVLTCGVQSTIRLKKTGVPAIMVFIEVPDDTRMERAKSRGSFDSVEWQNRLSQDIAFRSSSDYKDHVDITINNVGDLDIVVDTLIERIEEVQNNKG